MAPSYHTADRQWGGVAPNPEFEPGLAAYDLPAS